MDKLLRTLLLGVMAFSLLSACRSGTEETTLQDFGPVVVGHMPGIGNAPIYIGVDKGYFEEEGITIELQSFNSSSFMMPLLATGQLDVGGGQAGTELFNAIHQGLEIKLVGPLVKQSEGHDVVPYLIRKELFDSGAVSEPADLKGKNIAINVERGLAEYYMVNLLALGDLTLDDVNVITLPFTEMSLAFGNGAIDLAIIPEPLASGAVQDGNAEVFMKVSEVFNDPTTSFIIFGKRLLEPENHEIGIRFYKAYLRAVRELLTDEGYSEENLEIISSYSNVPPSTIKNLVTGYLDPNGEFSTSFIEGAMLYFIEQGYTEFSEPLDLNLVFDRSFAEEAVERIGRFEK